jgi:hypothetical protein
MRLSEIKILERDTDDDHRPWHGSSDFVVKYDGIQPDDTYYDDMQVSVKFHKERDDEDGAGSCAVTGLFLDAPVKQYDNDDKLVKTWPKGTDVEKMPGFEKSDKDWFQSKLEDHLS